MTHFGYSRYPINIQTRSIIRSASLASRLQSGKRRLTGEDASESSKPEGKTLPDRSGIICPEHSEYCDRYTPGKLSSCISFSFAAYLFIRLLCCKASRQTL